MKLICPNCHYQRPADASADARLSASCDRCGTPLEQLLWTNFQSTPLQLKTTAPAAAPTAVVDQGIMENQNDYAPSADPLGEDVLEIPRPLRSTQHAGEQLLVLEDVVPAPAVHDLSPWDEGLDPQMQDEVESDSGMLLSEEDDDELTLVSPSGLGGDRPAGMEDFASARTSAPDYEGYRAWVRIAPLLLLLGALAFFSLYYLGNRMGESGRQDTAPNAATNPATNPATQPETQTAAAAATSPQGIESAPPESAKPPESSVVGASAETQKPDQKSKVETARVETAPAAPAPVDPSPVAAAAPSTSSSPAADHAVGNFTVQVGSYNEAAQAEERAGRLRASGIEARVVRDEIPRRGTWYRVQAGRFASQEEATRFASEIKGKGATDDFIITAAQ
jgi:cell division protein FtsN